MPMFIVTVETDKASGQERVTGACPVVPTAICTDAGGMHHSFLSAGMTAMFVETIWTEAGYRVVRVELAVTMEFTPVFGIPNPRSGELSRENYPVGN